MDGLSTLGHRAFRPKRARWSARGEFAEPVASWPTGRTGPVGSLSEESSRAIRPVGHEATGLGKLAPRTPRARFGRNADAPRSIARPMVVIF